MRHLPLKLRYMLRESIREAVEADKSPAEVELEQLEEKEKIEKQVKDPAMDLKKSILKFQETGVAPSIHVELEKVKKILDDVISSPESHSPKEDHVIELTPSSK